MNVDSSPTSLCHCIVLSSKLRSVFFSQTAMKRALPITKFFPCDVSLLLTKVISGGQVGADRAGLEAALEVGISTGGGFAPRNFVMSKGADLELKTKFHLTEITMNGASFLRVFF